MAGLGPKMIRSVMKLHHAKSLEELIEEAGRAGVRIHVCEMSMGVMGLKAEELIDYPQLELVGVGSFVALASDANATFFL